MARDKARDRARLRSAWLDLVSKVQRELPRDATPQERGEAMKRASDIYHGRRRPSARRNPRGASLTQLALVGGAIYLGARMLEKLGQGGGTVSILPAPDGGGGASAPPPPGDAPRRKTY